MTSIGDLFIKIGLKVEGMGGALELDKGMTKLASNATKLLVGLGAINAAFYTMLLSAGNAGQELLQFSTSTGMSSEMLQRWQLAATKTGVGADEVTQAFKAMQSAAAEVKAGGGDWAPFQKMGVSLNQTTEEMLLSLSKGIQESGMDEEFVRTMSKFGFGENFLQFLQRGDTAQKLKEVNEQFIITNKERDRLAAMNAQWRVTVMELDNVKMKFMSIFAEHAGEWMKTLEYMVDRVAAFVKWLDGGSTGAKWFIIAVKSMIQVLGVMAAVLAAIAVTAAIAFAPEVAGIMLAALAVTVLFNAWNEFIGAGAEGESAFSWLADLARSLSDILNKLNDLRKIFTAFENSSPVLKMIRRASQLSMLGPFTPLALLSKPGKGISPISNVSTTNNQNVVYNLSGTAEQLLDQFKQLQKEMNAASSMYPATAAAPR